jgi:hypothetical protein
MKPNKNEILSEKLKCESCGDPFECGAKSGSCWCFSVAIEPQSLAQLKEQFQNCLCFNCLQKSSPTIIKNNKE